MRKENEKMNDEVKRQNDEENYFIRIEKEAKNEDNSDTLKMSRNALKRNRDEYSSKIDQDNVEKKGSADSCSSTKDELNRLKKERELLEIERQKVEKERAWQAQERSRIEREKRLLESSYDEKRSFVKDGSRSNLETSLYYNYSPVKAKYVPNKDMVGNKWSSHYNRADLTRSPYRQTYSYSPYAADNDYS